MKDKLLHKINDLPTNKFPISEIFYSIQGEGKYVGVRSIFVRFQFCNLTCTWCDTKYTWYANSGKHFWKNITDLANIIVQKILQYEVYNIIFTGGEPLLFRVDKLASYIINILNEKCISQKIINSIHFHIESNGTISLQDAINITLNDQTKIQRNSILLLNEQNWTICISPKLSNSKQVEKVDFDSWKKYSNLFFKFVINSINDLDEVKVLVEKYKIDNQLIYIILEGKTRETQINPQLVEAIINYKYHYSPRLHVILWKGKEKDNNT